MSYAQKAADAVRPANWIDAFPANSRELVAIHRLTAAVVGLSHDIEYQAERTRQSTRINLLRQRVLEALADRVDDIRFEVYLDTDHTPEDSSSRLRYRVTDTRRRKSRSGLLYHVVDIASEVEAIVEDLRGNEDVELAEA